MSYYMGDFYRGARGDYYMGDPGIGAFFRKAAGFLGIGLGGPAGAIVKVGAGAGGGMVRAAGTAVMSRAGVMAGKVVRVVKQHPVLSAAGAAGAVGIAGAAAERAMAGPGMAPRGFHLSRRTGALVRNRRMRVTNPRALRRSLRRVAGFARLARKVLHITHPRLRGRVTFKFRKRRKAA